MVPCAALGHVDAASAAPAGPAWLHARDSGGHAGLGRYAPWGGTA